VSGFLVPIEHDGEEWALRVIEATYNPRVADESGNPYPWSSREIRKKLADVRSSGGTPGAMLDRPSREGEPFYVVRADGSQEHPTDAAGVYSAGGDQLASTGRVGALLELSIDAARACPIRPYDPEALPEGFRPRRAAIPLPLGVRAGVAQPASVQMGHVTVAQGLGGGGLRALPGGLGQVQPLGLGGPRPAGGSRTTIPSDQDWDEPVIIDDTDEAAKRAIVEQMNARFAYVKLSRDAVIVDTVSNAERRGGERAYLTSRGFLTEQQRYPLRLRSFTAKGAEKLVMLNRGELWLGHPRRRQYEEWGFAPERSPAECEVVNPSTGYRRLLNTYQGFAVKSNDRGLTDCPRFAELIDEVIADGSEESSRYIWSFFADIFQRPADKSGVALYLYSPEKGTGKGTLLRAMGLLLGRYYQLVQSADQVAGQWNLHLADKLLIFFDEARGLDSRDKADRLNSLITESEYATLERGVRQRGEALRLFLREYYGGGTSYQKVIPEDVLQRIVERSGDAGFKGLVQPDMIAFPYGPDIIRTPDGGWAVIEDNPGYIGGRGDLAVARKSLLKRQPEYKKAAAGSPDPMKYYENLVREARARAKPPGSKVIIYMVPPYPDHEDDRLQSLFKKYDVETVTPEDSKLKLGFDQEGAYVRKRKLGKDAPKERVGYIFINGEHKWVDPSHDSTEEALLISEAREFLKEGEVPKKYVAELREILEGPGRPDVPRLRKLMKKADILWNTKLIERESAAGLMKAIYRGQVASDYAPGMDFIGDKEFYVYVDDLIRHYLHQEPTVKNLPTRRMTGAPALGDPTLGRPLKLSDKSPNPQLNHELFDELFGGDAYKSYVFKIVDGRGGDGVWIGAKMKPDEVVVLKEKIRAMPETFIAQKYTPLSKIEDRIVDIRMISQVYPDGMSVSPVPWGRGLPDTGNGKVNLSDQGREFTVLVVPDPEPASGNRHCLGAAAAILSGLRK
jgi:uncharacterized circularly permuted ATP-grasp superfamily protein